MKNLTDESLVALFAQGKNEAFDELLNRYKNDVFAYIYSSVQNRELAEDLFQDTFTKVITTVKSGRYQESGRFVGFLFRIAHNVIIDVHRQEQNVQMINEGDVEYNIFDRVEELEGDFATSREEDLSYRQVLKDIRRMIHFLPESQQEIVIMRFYKDLSFKEIADQLGISINTALGRIRYAVLNMRRLAEEHNISLAV